MTTIDYYDQNRMAGKAKNTESGPFRNLSFTKEAIHSVISQKHFLETSLGKILADLKARGRWKKKNAHSHVL